MLGVEPLPVPRDARWARKAASAASAAAPSTPVKGDRFIPVLPSACALEASHVAVLRAETENTPNRLARAMDTSPARDMFRAVLSAEVLGDPNTTGKILSFTQKPAPKASSVLQQASLRALYAQNTATAQSAAAPRAQARFVAKAPVRVLDAPEMADDYYLNLLDWSATNCLAVGLGCNLYLWDADSGATRLLMNTAEDNSITSVRWMPQGTHVAVGTSSGDVQLWDIARSRQVRCMRGHTARVGSLSWSGTTLASASRDASILIHDVRIQEHVTAVLREHTQEVCGLEFAPNVLGTGSLPLLASGANDNLVKVWDASRGNCGSRLTLSGHMAAAKAVAWCPWQANLLATGGGTADRCIRFWNTQTGTCINTIDTHAQVTSIQWSTTHRELVSAHGYSQNQLTVWRYPTMERVADLLGHESRILHTARSPDGSIVVSAAADETLRFWNIWPAQNATSAIQQQKPEGKDGSMRYQLLR